MKKLMTMAFFIALVGLVFMAPEAAAADASSAKGVGGDLTSSLVNVVQGNLGLFAGIALALFGLYTWLVAQNTGTGIIMIIGGVIVTAFPGIFAGLAEGAQKLAGAAGADDDVVEQGFTKTGSSAGGGSVR